MVHVTDVKKITLTEQVADEYEQLGKEGRFSKKCIPQGYIPDFDWTTIHQNQDQPIKPIKQQDPTEDTTIPAAPTEVEGPPSSHLQFKTKQQLTPNEQGSPECNPTPVDLLECNPAEIQVLHDDIPGYDLPTIDFVNTTTDLDEDVSILEEDNSPIYAYLNNVLVHMIDKQQTAIFKSNQDFNKNKEKISQYIKYAENWQVASVICSYTAMACDVLLIVAMIVFLLKYQKTMQAMLTAFLQSNTKNNAIQAAQADWIGRTYPPLFTINLPKEEEIIDDLREITTMEYVVQVIMIIVCIAIVLIIMYYCCTKCRHPCAIFKYCFPFLPISRIVCTSRRTDLFVEVTNVTKGSGIWAHFVSNGCFPTQIQLSRPIQKDDVHIETICCIFKWIRINWSNINVTGISGTMINMPDTAYVSIFMDNDLTRITEDHFEIKLIARLLDQMYVIEPPVFPPRYDDASPSAPQFPEHLHSLLTHS